MCNRLGQRLCFQTPKEFNLPSPLVSLSLLGKHIVEYEQQGNERAEYGSYLLDRLVKDLKERYGVGFSRSNVHYMRKLYIAFPNCTTLTCKLSWRHYVEIIKGDAPLEAGFYVILIKPCLFI